MDRVEFLQGHKKKICVFIQVFMYIKAFSIETWYDKLSDVSAIRKTICKARILTFTFLETTWSISLTF